MLKNGGNWLGAAHKWLLWHKDTGGHLTWGSQDAVHMTVKEIEELALEVAIAAYGDVQSKRYVLGAPLKRERKLGRFGHHPYPAVDFCVEVDAIESLAEDVKVGLATSEILKERVFRAMLFKVGGGRQAIEAKKVLRKVEDAIKAQV